MIIMKTYIKPTMTVVRIQHRGMLMLSVTTNLTDPDDIIYEGGGSGDAFAREEIGIWDEEW
jgi:hypothetical protein